MILGCAISSIARAKHGCTGGWLKLWWRVSQSQNGRAIFTLTKWLPMFGSVVFDYQWCILIVMSVKSSFYNEYDIKNNEKHVLWAQRSFQNHHQTFHDRCPEKIGPLPKKSDHWFTRTCPENMGLAPTWWIDGSCRLGGPRASPITRWRLALYFPDTEFHTFFSGQVPISSDIHVVRTFPDMSGARPSCRSWPDCSLRPFL